MTWLRDEDFIRGKIPMTKFAVRAVTIALLDITPGDVLLDIGAGTGSISIQAALLGAEVYAIEQAQEGIDLIRRNAEKFAVKVSTIHGSAPETIKEVPKFNKCFIGGSKGKLEQIVRTVDARIDSGGILTANFIKLGNTVSTVLRNNNRIPGGVIIIGCLPSFTSFSTSEASPVKSCCITSGGNTN